MSTHRGQRALRLLTAGSVDDGKSTLIGRLLLDSQAILADQLDALERRAGGEPIDLSLLTDGLEAEREQGITIDVAYRYFATPARKFIIADAPGHEQYTRNMVTAAAGSDCAVVLVDITKLDWQQRPVALLPQTRRHALLAQLLRVSHIVFAVNKLDAIEANAAAAFAAVREALLAFAEAAGIRTAGVVPISALRGDHVIATTPLAGYSGPSLLELLESLPETHSAVPGPFRLPVQFVARQGDGRQDGRGENARVLWGRIAQGRVQVGDDVQVFPSGQTARVAAIQLNDGDVQQAGDGVSAGLVLDRQLDVSRGDWIGAVGALPAVREFTATLSWLDTEPAVVGRKYLLRHGHRWVPGRIVAIEHCLNIHTLQAEDAHELGVNQIGRVRVQPQEPLPLQPYASDRVGGALIVVDATSHRTSGALLVQEAA